MSPSNTADLVLAAVGLLNLKGALISCFAGMLFVITITMMTIFICCRSKVKLNETFTSFKGSFEFDIWRVLYEKIESSSINEVLRFVLKSKLAALRSKLRPSKVAADEKPKDVQMDPMPSQGQLVNVKGDVIFVDGPAHIVPSCEATLAGQSIVPPVEKVTSASAATPNPAPAMLSPNCNQAETKIDSMVVGTNVNDSSVRANENATSSSETSIAGFGGQVQSGGSQLTYPYGYQGQWSLGQA